MHAISILLAAAAAFAAPTATAEGRIVNVYSSRHYPVDEQIHAAFTQKTGIKVQHVQVKEAAQLIERVKAEGAGGSADVVVTADVGNLWRAEDAGILQPSEVPGAKEALAPELRHPQGLWYGLSQRARIIVYNKTKVKDGEIERYEDLADPKWKGRVLVRSSSHVYNQSLIASLVQHLGEQKAGAWTGAIAGNLARKPEGGDTDQIKATAAGVGDVAIVNSYYLARLMRSKDTADQAVVAKLGYVFPNQHDRGTHVNLSGAGVAKHSKHPGEATAYIAFLLTPEVQRLYATDNGEFPTVTSLKGEANLLPFAPFKADTTSLATIGKLTPVAVKLTDQSQWR
jgi:iron(III) transport system substrate-binding protein